ncbi:sodium/hydrogen exchanger 4 isoform X1 [Prosopis cineraria]|uniref:sodium/hydrogen exchanger 4 isoform X1 n=1 Tax=Prosopis cineraria TaxID=364024 RepID=UPI00240ED464|nr:sodium/hydrogen exchanger 4 isoform X1 [Prosopis cineraria]XP_054796709.1 sodium/hydrogen exchanger 4 isoform X1 [Prosopis cineraria]
MVMAMLNWIPVAAKNLAHEHAQVIPISLFVAVLCLCLLIGHLLEENRWVNESIVAILVGCIAGMILLFITKGKSSRILTFDEELFFIYLLPPIIFNAGFQVKKKQFFHNFLTIMLFGVIGVFISASIVVSGSWWLFPKLNFIGLTVQDYLAIGTIFSSTDTVCTLQVLNQDETPLLYSLVFGEGVVNDATSVVLFNAVRKLDASKVNGRALHVMGDFLYLFSTSTALGFIAGLLTAYILKALCFGRHSSVREIALMVLMAYLSYMLAELLGLSGILTVFFCGLLMSHYAWHNVTETSRVTTRHVFATMSFIAETFIFLYVGMDALDMEKWRITNLSFWSLMGIYSCLIFLILIGRAAFVFPLSALANCLNRRAHRDSRITFRHQIIIWWAGLMRGAVSIALAFKQFTYSGVTFDPVDATMITNTIIVVLFSTLVFGILTKPLIRYLLPHSSTRKNIAHQESSPPIEDLNLPLLSFEESTATNISRAKESLSMLMESPVHTIHHYWRKFDDAYMRPVFGGPLA